MIIENFYKSRKVRVYKNYAPSIRSERAGLMIVEEIPISTNGTEISGTIRATYYKNGERNIEENIKHGLGYEGVIEPVIVASRGRNPTNPSDRTVGSPTEQRLEVNMSGCSNTITTVEKDNYILEIKE